MGKYGSAAEIAARSLVTSGGNPRTAWGMAVSKVFPASSSSREKGCPRDSFLTLCEMGVIKGVASGCYTQSVKNKAYVVRALREIRNNAFLADDEQALWHTVTEDSDKTPNHQMDVVISLWRGGFIELKE